MRRPPSKRAIAKAAWQEFKQAKSVGGHASEPLLATERPPAGFIAIELGFGFGEGPSLSATMAHCDEQNAARLKQATFATKRAAKRENGETKQARLQALLGASAAVG